MNYQLQLMSVGLKNNVGKAKEGFRSLPVADMYFDCRTVQEKGITGRFGATGNEVASGLDPVFQQHIEEASGAALMHMRGAIEQGLLLMKDRKGADFKGPVKICFFCAWGVHRSVASKMIIAKWLKEAGHDVEVF